MNRRILFADDEPSVLEGLQRMLRSMRHQWDMAFVDSARKALDAMGSQTFDVIVTDMKMPGLDGAQLLTEVKRCYPRMIRIILSGHVDQETLLRSVELAHQFIAKPCDAETLKDIVTRSSALHDLLEDESLKQIVSGMRSLPSLPSLYFEIMRELRSPQGSMAQVGKIISRDIAMSARILQLVNSAFFGMPRKIANPVQAAVYLGMETIRSLVLSLHIFSQFSESRITHFSLDRLWQHSMLTAAAAKEIAGRETRDQTTIDCAFMAGMLHDVGKIVLADNIPERYQEVCDRAAAEGLSMAEAEGQLLSVTHAEIGAYLLGLWGLQDPLVEAVCFHHRPAECPNQAFSPLTAVYVADALQYEEELPDIEKITGIDLNYLEKIGKPDNLPAWREAFGQVVQKGNVDE